MKYSLQGSLISLAEELPAQDLVSLSSMYAVDLSSDSVVLKHKDAKGFMPLRSWLQSEWQQHKGMEVDVNQILLTTDSEQGIDLLIRLYIEPGDIVFVESPTSPSTLQILRLQGAMIISMDGDQEGVIPHSLEQLLKVKIPKLLMITPNFTNPSGVLWSLERRQIILDLCRKYQVLILEDDTYGDLHFDETMDPNSFNRRYPSLCALDNHGMGGQVLYMGSFNKTLAPELRTGWAVGNHKLIDALADTKSFVEYQSSNMNQQLLYQLLVSTTFDWYEHIALLNREYSSRLELLHALLKQPAWKQVTYALPSGGMFLWLQLPEGLRSEALLKCSIRKGVDFCPGMLCFANKSDGSGHIRLNFAQPGRDDLIQGMHLLSEAVNEFTARS